MTSVANSPFRQISLDNEFYIPIGNMIDRVLAINTNTNTLSTAAWAGTGTGGRWLSSLSSAGAGLLKDMGRTYVSGGRTFRKVQLVVPQSTGTVSTGGVNGGATGAQPLADYLTGFIEVGFSEAAGSTPAPVAKWGR
jgi:hypothetical protein